jgi:predicted transcriptional regulator
MSDPDSPILAREDLKFLSGSPERLKLLVELQKHSLSPVELSERTGVSDDTTRALLKTGAERSWIIKERSTGDHTLTVAGDLVLQAYLDAETLSRELFAFLANSTTRLRVLRYLESKPLSPVELNNRIPVSDPTVYRALHGFEEHGLIDRRKKPELTPAGMKVYAAYRQLADVVRWTAEYTEVLQHLGGMAEAMPVQTLTEDRTEVVVNSIAYPDAVLDRFNARLEEVSSERIRGVLPSMCGSVKRMHQSLLDQKTELEIVIDEAVLEVARSSYPEILDSVAGTESTSLFVHPEKLRLGLAVFDSSVFMFIYGDRSLIACIETASDVFMTWAANTYQTRRQAAYLLNNQTV